MRRFLKRVVAVAAVACLPLSAPAALVVDQSNTSASNGSFCYLGVGELCGQSFVQTNGNIAGAGFLIDPSYSAGSGTVTVSIYSSYSSTPTGLIASGTSGTVDSNTGWLDIFWSPAALTVGDQYYMVIESSADTLVASYTVTAGYAAGNALHNGSTNEYVGYDLAFKTYYDDGAGQVPEPMTLGLVGLGLGLAGLAIGRRKAA